MRNLVLSLALLVAGCGADSTVVSTESSEARCSKAQERAGKCIEVGLPVLRTKDNSLTIYTPTATLSQSECERDSHELGIPPTATVGCDISTIPDADEP